MTWNRGALLALIALGLALTSAAVAGSATRATRLLDEDYGPFEVRPATVILGATGAVLFGGQRRPSHRFGHIAWRSWANGDAYGKAIYWVDTCKPDCGSGKYANRGKTELHAWRAVQGRFTRLTANGPNVHQTLRLIDVRGVRGWTWS